MRQPLLRHINKVLDGALWLKGKRHYVRQARSLLGTPVDFGSLYHRMVIAHVLFRKYGDYSPSDEALLAAARLATAGFRH